MSKVIDVYDDVFEEHNAIILDDNVKQIHWKYDYYSNKNEVNKHWHIYVVMTKKNVLQLDMIGLMRCSTCSKQNLILKQNISLMTMLEFTVMPILMD